MKVKELIELLNLIDGELDITIESSGGEYNPDEIRYAYLVIEKIYGEPYKSIVLSSYNSIDQFNHLTVEKRIYD